MDILLQISVQELETKRVVLEFWGTVTYYVFGSLALAGLTFIIFVILRVWSYHSLGVPYIEEVYSAVLSGMSRGDFIDFALSKGSKIRVFKTANDSFDIRSVTKNDTSVLEASRERTMEEVMKEFKAISESNKGFPRLIARDRTPQQ